VKLGLQLGYWGSSPPSGVDDLIREAERCGFDAVFTAEAYGSDAFTPLAWHGSATSRLKLGTSIVQMSGRSPASIAMHTLTLDHLSEGRFILGLGASGPQVVEGWYGQPFSRPLARTREVVRIIRNILAREGPLTNSGPMHPLPYDGPDATGLGKPLKSITHPLRADVPIWLAAEGPKNVAQTAEIADGWLPLFYSPQAAELFNPWLDEGFARPGARHTRATFEIAAPAPIFITDDPPRAVQTLKPMLALYIGGMGAKDANFHKEMFVRMGYADAADRVQDLFLEGKHDAAAAAVPDELVDSISMAGDVHRVRDRISQWSDAGVTTLMVGGNTPEQIREIAEVVLGG
jgi:F420-dependent oxidoreductase-like protein